MLRGRDKGAAHTVPPRRPPFGIVRPAHLPFSPPLRAGLRISASGGSRSSVMASEKDGLPATKARGPAAPDKYSVLLPTYNERENLPLIVWLLVKCFSER